MTTPWFAVAVGFARDPRFVAAGPDNWPLWMAGEAYCGEQFTDGVIPKAVIPTLVPGWTPERHFAAAAALAGRGIWELGSDGAATSLDFLKYNEPAEARRQAQAAQRERMRKLRDRRGGRDGARAQLQVQDSYSEEKSRSSTTGPCSPARAPSPPGAGPAEFRETRAPRLAAPVSRPPGRAFGRSPRPIAEEIHRQVSPAWRRPGA